MMHVFLLYFGLPGGAIWSNVLAEPVIFALTFAVAFPLRHKIGRKLVAWFHKHHAAHLAALEKEKGSD